MSLSAASASLSPWPDMSRAPFVNQSVINFLEASIRGELQIEAIAEFDVISRMVFGNLSDIGLVKIASQIRCYRFWNEWNHAGGDFVAFAIYILPLSFIVKFNFPSVFHADFIFVAVLDCHSNACVWEMRSKERLNRLRQILNFYNSILCAAWICKNTNGNSDDRWKKPLFNS